MHKEEKAMLLLLVSSQGQDKVSVEVLEPRWGAESVLMPGWTIYLSIYKYRHGVKLLDDL